jgi:hypothetical protein
VDRFIGGMKKMIDTLFKLFINSLAFLFCILTLGFVDMRIIYTDGTRFQWVGWISRAIGKEDF